MMQCTLCHDTNGPFEFEDYKKRVVLVCEDCGKKIRKEAKKYETANLRNTRYAR